MRAIKGRLTFSDVLVAVGFCLVLLIFTPILVPLLVFALLKHRVQQGRLRRFVAKNEGGRYFCYTSKASGLPFTRDQILPYLPDGVTVIYMSQRGRKNLGDESIIDTLVGMEAGGAKRGGYPCVAIVADGRLVSESLNTELYRTILKGGDAEHLLQRIRIFYESGGHDASLLL